MDTHEEIPSGRELLYHRQVLTTAVVFSKTITSKSNPTYQQSNPTYRHSHHRTATSEHSHHRTASSRHSLNHIASSRHSLTTQPQGHSLKFIVPESPSTYSPAHSPIHSLTHKHTIIPLGHQSSSDLHLSHTHFHSRSST